MILKELGEFEGRKIYRVFDSNIDNEPALDLRKGFRFWLAMRIYDFAEWLIWLAMHKIIKHPKARTTEPQGTYKYTMTFAEPPEKPDNPTH